MIDQDAISKEVTYRTSRSSGSGGQHVNKVETRVEVILDLNKSTALDETQKQRIRSRLGRRIHADGTLSATCGETRSQKRNREIALNRLLELIELALKRKKMRKKTRMPKGANEKRLKKKRHHSEKKSRRGFNPDP